jgi:hypothetical protein
MTRRLVELTAAVCALVLVLLHADVASAEKRVALVIGNGSYQNVNKLDNPSKDAAAMADMFRKAGFDVVDARNDLGVLTFKRAIRDFFNTVRNADIAVVYYAGHGIEVSGTNYLIPVDAKLATDYDAEDEAVALDRIIRALEPAKRLRLVILDACRDNPFQRKMQRTVAMRGLGTGLAVIEPPTTDTLIAYAARAGSTAEDGDDGHSPFTRALLKNLAEPGLDVRIAFGRVRDDVLKATGNRQEPFVYGSLGGTTISLVPPAPQPKVVTSNEIRADYELAERVGTLAAWDSFLAIHGTGFYAELAKSQRSKLLAGAPPSPATASDPKAPPADQKVTVAALDRATSKPPESPDRVTPDRLAWDRVRDSNDPAVLRDFIRRYPDSPLAIAAQRRVDVLEAAAAQRQKEEEDRRAKAAAEAQRQQAERAAALQREEEERRAKAAEAARLQAERETARQREEAERLSKMAEAERQKAERQAALRREAEAVAERKRQEAACRNDEQEFARLRNSGLKAHDDMVRFQQRLGCEKLRPAVAAVLDQWGADAAKMALISSAQKELIRIGCYPGRETGALDNPTKQAVQDYWSKRGKPNAEIDISDQFVSDLKRETRIENCIATPEPPKPQPVARGDESKPDTGKKSTTAAKPPKNEEKKGRAARREQPAPRAREEASSRPQSPAPRIGGTMTGIGF